MQIDKYKQLFINIMSSIHDTQNASVSQKTGEHDI